MYKHFEKDQKKLTDNEIIKALELCIGENCNCKDCAFHGVCVADGNDTQLLINTLDLIHRLQAEKQKVVQDYYCASQTCEEQKAEIERLTKLAGDKELKAIIAQNCILNEQNDELQKQVDELEQRYLDESKERCKFEQLYGKKCHEHNIGLGVQRNAWEKKVQQAVKDTAKEIYCEIDGSDILVVNTQEYGEIEVVPMERLKEIVKSKDVEVE